ncbi:MAG: cardiolipin synthase [Clostridiales bacterium]|nr:cardiolipin synthase [Clostridiales bacterium]
MKSETKKRARQQLDAAREHLRSPKESIFKRIARLLTHRLLLTIVLILLQIAVMLVMILVCGRYFVHFYVICVLISMLVVLYILNKRGHPDYKIAWMLIILPFPIFGGLLYLLLGGSWTSNRSLKRMERLEILRHSILSGDDDTIQDFVSQHPDAANQMRYIYATSSCPPYVNTETEYLPIGEVYYAHMVEELKQAKHYIFLQYFIIKEGEMWNTVLSILEEKAAQGVDVRVIYDDIGCLFTLPKRYSQELEKRGIACAVFNPFRPVASLRLNNRDHRKLCIVDGVVGFTGGINLSDEYINQWERFGHWKDTGILLRGQAVWSLTAIFLSCWDYTKNIEEKLDNYRPAPSVFGSFQTDGIVQPYNSNPGNESVGAAVYMNLINRAKRYLYITTPYLVIDDAMTNSLCAAALSGVDVRIITPHIPDKRYVFMLTQAHYIPLLEAGVKIYEYTPGFVHSKTFAVDDEFGVVGTVNLDYRSFYLHYEDGVWMYKSSAVAAIRDDFLSTQALSQQVQLEEVTRMSWLKRFGLSVLRIIAPLM